MSSFGANISVVPSLAKIVIRVLNKDQSRPDDVLVFDPDSSTDGFNVTFLQPYINSKSEFYLDYEGVVPYVETFFNCLLADADSASVMSVQVDMPGLPSVLLTKSSLKSYLTLVFDSHMDTLRETDWPMESSTSGGH